MESEAEGSRRLKTEKESLEVTVASEKKDTSKRELISPNGDKRYIRRDESGQFTDSQDDVGRSLSSDVRQHSKKTVESGHGDEGDQDKGKRSS